ncbi:hypothetical protein GGS20DRAFT_590136 [Poronia punctata]|nr:hypothetical protein GGS20DRAFT_590136 [Poronia punctata]
MAQKTLPTIPLPDEVSYTQGQANQTSFALAPEFPTAEGGGGVEKNLFAKSLQAPKSFGKLAHINVITFHPAWDDITGNFVFARNRKSTGTIKHGLYRRNKHERARYSPLRRPDPRTQGNYDGRELTALERRFCDIAVNYPDVKHGIMKAPFNFRTTTTFVFPEQEQSCTMMEVFRTFEFRELIIQHLMPRFEDLTNLFSSCQAIAKLLQSDWMHLDSSRLDFLNLDMCTVADMEKERDAAPDDNEESQAKQVKQAKRAKICLEKLSSTCIISPIRKERQGKPQTQVLTENDYPLNSQVKPSRKTPLCVAMHAHYKLMHLSYLNGNLLKDLLLIAQPWMTVSALKGIIPAMPKLRNLGVHNCFLMNFGVTQELLQAVNTHNEARQAQNRPHIALDFTPFYYRGPGWQHGDHVTGHTHFGEFGLVPEEWDWLDTPRALGAQLLAIDGLCYKGKQDLLTPGTGFRSFLDRLPLRPYQLPNMLDAIARIRDLNEEKHGRTGSFSRPVVCKTGMDKVQGFKKPVINPKLLRAMQITVYSSFMVICNGRPMKEKEVLNLLTLAGHFKLEKCHRCLVSMPAYFFTQAQQRRDPRYVLCHGCELGHALLYHIYRLNDERRETAESIFGVGSQERTLQAVLKNIAKPAQFTRNAIRSRPGDPDITLWEKAQWLDMQMTVAIPQKLADTKAAIKILEGKRTRAWHKARQEELRKKELEDDQRKLEFVLAIGQRNRCGGLSTENRLCRSWEHEIKEYRTALALDRGPGYDTGNVPIRFGRSGVGAVAAMMGLGANTNYIGVCKPAKEVDPTEEDEWMLEYSNLSQTTTETEDSIESTSASFGTTRQSPVETTPEDTPEPKHNGPAYGAEQENGLVTSEVPEAPEVAGVQAQPTMMSE